MSDINRSERWGGGGGGGGPSPTTPSSLPSTPSRPWASPQATDLSGRGREMGDPRAPPPSLTPLPAALSTTSSVIVKKERRSPYSSASSSSSSSSPSPAPADTGYKGQYSLARDSQMMVDRGAYSQETGTPVPQQQRQQHQQVVLKSMDEGLPSSQYLPHQMTPLPLPLPR
ncbi:hypothetical protein ACOMHN_015960 [Nucella lapillus]